MEEAPRVVVVVEEAVEVITEVTATETMEERPAAHAEAEAEGAAGATTPKGEEEPKGESERQLLVCLQQTAKAEAEAQKGHM